MNFAGSVQNYPYLFTNIVSFFLFVVGGRLILQKRHWSVMMISGALNAPFFPFLILLENEYWTPVRMGGWPLGVEDMLCSFLVAILLGSRIKVRQKPKILWARYRIIAGVSVLIFLLGYLAGLTGMTSLVFACVVIAGLLILRMRQLWPVAVMGVIGFALLYSLIVKIYFFLWPDFVLQWNTRAFGGLTIGGIPLGEIIWAAVFGAYWPVFMMHVLDLRYVKSVSPEKS